MNKTEIIDYALRLCCVDDELRPAMKVPFINTFGSDIIKTWAFATNGRVLLGIDSTEHITRAYHRTPKKIEGNEYKNLKAEKILFDNNYEHIGYLKVADVLEQTDNDADKAREMWKEYTFPELFVYAIHDTFTSHENLHLAMQAFFFMGIEYVSVKYLKKEAALYLEAKGMCMAIMPVHMDKDRQHNATITIIQDTNHEIRRNKNQCINVAVATERIKAHEDAQAAAAAEAKRIEEEYKKSHRIVWRIPVQKIVTGEFFVEARTYEEAMAIAEKHADWADCDDEGEVEIVEDEIEEDVEHDELRKMNLRDEIITSDLDDKGKNIVVRVGDCTFLDKPES